MPLIYLCLLSCVFLSVSAYASNHSPEVLESIEVREKKEDSFSAYWEENQGTQIFSGKKNTLTNLKQIPKLQTNNYRQATSQTPGLLISEVPNESLAAITFRGLGDPHESYNVLLLQDGLPVTSDMYGYPAHYYSPALPMMNKVQFIRGGAGLLYGPQPGGVLNYLSSPLSKNQQTKGQVGLTFGTYNLLSSLNTIYGSSGDHAYGVEYFRRQGDGPQRINSNFEADYVQIRDQIFKGKNSYKISFNGYDSDHGETGGFAKDPGTDANVFGDDLGKASKQHDRLKVSRAQLALVVEHKIDENSNFEAAVWASAYQRYSKRQNGSGFGTFATGTTNTIINQKYYSLNGQIRYLKNYQAFGNEHTFSGGLLTYNLLSPITQETGSRADANSGTMTARSERRTRANSIFAENRFTLGQLMITPGIRVENISQSIEERKGSMREKQRNENVPLLGFGLAYHLNDEAQAYANISESYKPLTWAETIPTQTNQTVEGDIREAKTLSSELGFRGQKKYLTWDISIFHIRYENRIGTVGTTIKNVGAGTHQGIDVACELNLSQMTGTKSKLGDFILYANSEILDAQFTRGPQRGKTPQYAPKTITRAGAIFSKDNHYKVALMGVFVGRHFGNDDNTNNFEISPYTIFDLTADYNLSRDWILSGGINNLLNRKYYSRVRSDGIIWALDRNLYLGASMKF